MTMKATQLLELYEGQTHGALELLNKYHPGTSLNKDGEFALRSESEQFDVSYMFDHKENGSIYLNLELSVDGIALYTASLELGNSVKYHSIESQQGLNEVYLWSDMEQFLRDLIERDMLVSNS